MVDDEKDFDETLDVGDDALPSELEGVTPDDYSKLPDDNDDEPDPTLEKVS